ncbi:hypothetical protein Q5P01_024675 [Channa striata]|uniref:Rab11 family-interacting protein 1 n=1 Tax=Channa striata TaxID=64152 RepID=A0AA88LPZ2_CHASR|nr:hypothetical protein Q5P01_024675 [Channa striata]
MSLADQQWCPTSVQVTVLQARGLRIKGKSGTNDAYAVMQVGKEKYQTSVVEKSVAPVWKEEAAFDLPPQAGGGGGGGAGAERGTLHVHVLHRALVGPDKLLGQAVINLLQLGEDETRNKTEWFKLLDKTGKADKDRGEVLLDIQFMRNNMTASMFDLSTAGKSRSRLGKFKDKVRGKKKESDTVSSVVPSFTQVLTDSEEEAHVDGEVTTGKDEKKKKHKMKLLFSPKSNLQKNMSQSMSVLPGKNSSLSGSQSSGLNVECSEGKKKFKFTMHKRSGSSDSKDSSIAHKKIGAAEQSNLCINGSHVYCEEPQSRTSRVGSNFSLASSGHGSMEEVPESSPQSTDSLRAVRQYSPWLEEEDMAEEENIKEDEDEDERIRMEEEIKKKADQEERVRRQEELKRLADEKRKQEEEEKRIEERVKRKEAERIQREEERKRQEEEERVRKEEQERLAEQKRTEEQERRIEEEKRQREEKEWIRMQKERALEQQREEEKVRREEERKLAEEKRRLEEEERRIAEEKIRKEEERAEEERRRQEEEERVRRQEEEMKKRIEEQERKQREEEERIKKEEERRHKEEERARKEKEEYERLVEEKKKLEEERKRIEAEEIFRREEEERIRREEERKKEEEQRRLEEVEKRQREEKEKIKREEERREEEERARKEKEEYERLMEEKKRQEDQERRQKEKEELIRKEQDRVRMEEEMKVRREQEEREQMRRREEQERKRAEEEYERLVEEERKRIEAEEILRREEEERMRREEERRREEEQEKIKKEEAKRREEEERRQEEELIKKREQERIMIEEEKRRQEEEERIRREREEMRRLAEEKRRIEEEEKWMIHQLFEEDPDSSTEPNSSTAKVSNVQLRCQSTVSQVEIKTISNDEKNLICPQREKRAAPQPPGRNQAESHRETDVSTRHLVQITKQTDDRDVRTASVLPQRSVQMIAPVSRFPTDPKSPQSLMQSSTSKATTSLPKPGKRPAPPRPGSVEEETSSEPKTDRPCVGSICEGGSEVKPVQVVYGLNPFDDDEDENEAEVEICTSSNKGLICWSPAGSQTASQTKIKSSKVVHAPLPPAGVSTPENNATQLCAPQPEATISLQERPLQESQVHSTMEEACGRQDLHPAASRRLQPVKPLNPLDQHSVSVIKGEADNKSTGFGEVQNKTKVNDSRLNGPYSQLTQEELISLVLKQEKQLAERDKKISELEQYIDNLLVRVMEEKPSILMSMTSMKKAV